jgi:hypothetical protein
MGLTWTTNDIATLTISLYETNITLNKAACKYFEDVNYVLLGYDDEKHMVAIKPISKDDIDNDIYPKNQLHRISLGKSYGRITNKSFIENISEMYHLDFKNNQCYKYKAKFDVIHQMMIFYLSKGDD